MTAKVRRRAYLAALCAVLPTVAAAASPTQNLYERALMSAAGRRCGFFAPDIAAALAASAWQARGAALRSGVDRASVAATEARAETKASATACASPDLALGAARVRSAFSGYSRLNSMDFPGDLGRWKAVRGVNAETHSGWRLAQDGAGRSGPMTFGIAADTGADRLTAVAGWTGARQAVGARLVVRDPSKSAEPYLDTRGAGLSRRAPPRSVSAVFLAAERAPAATNVLPVGVAAGTAFRFPAAAMRALAVLDPREALVVELVYSDRGGEHVEQVLFEVGDFAAAQAFLVAGR